MLRKGDWGKEELVVTCTVRDHNWVLYMRGFGGSSVTLYNIMRGWLAGWLAGCEAASKGLRGGSGVGDRRAAADIVCQGPFFVGRERGGEGGGDREALHCMGTSLETSARRKGGRKPEAGERGLGGEQA